MYCHFFLIIGIITHVFLQQVLNNTSERVCIYSPLIKSSVANQLPGLLTVIDAGQSYSLPVEIVNSRQQTGIFIGPEYEKLVIVYLWNAVV